MTVTNREIFTTDPTSTKIPNDGIAQVARPETDQQWQVLTWELQSFVCEGEYARGLERILNSFLGSLSQAQQPAVWISGFYGSGKSHLVRVLEYLWRDIVMPNGESARSLVRLPDEVQDHLTELSTAGKRLGGLWSAASTLAAGKSDAVRLAFLSVLFESAGLPAQYPLARFMIWARENGYVDTIRNAVAAKGKILDKEVHDLYVSPIIAEALLKADPTLGNSIKDVRDILKAQFPPTTKDIIDDEMFDVMDDVFRLEASAEGKLPLTLVVLDEMQQYIDDDHEKALAVQNIVEGCSARFESQVLFVATGQSALTATPTLQKLTDRFAVQVALSDKDVESVVRQVILRKKPDQIPTLQAKLGDLSGEIDRQLGGTQLAPKAADKADLVPDYPLLPTRRRFWELALRAIDRAGKAGVLRTQLKIVHEAAAAVAAKPVGHVVGGDFIYEQQSAGMQMSGVLLKEIDELIRGLRAEGGDGQLESRICALVFLISQLPSRTLGGETGLRATAPYLADLLVEDLADDGAPLRKRVPERLEALVSDGHLMQIDNEYRLQTEEGAEWEKDYRSRLAAIRDDASRIGILRNEGLLRSVDQSLGGLKLIHGKSKTPRKIDQHWGQDQPTADDGDIPVWIRDEWSVTEAAVKKSAAEAGDESPVVFVFLPRTEADQLKETLASHAAAQETVQQKPMPQTDEGKAALRAMKTRLATDEERLTGLFREVVTRARVFQGGGNEVTTSTLRDAVQTAGERSLVRLFPRFRDADAPNWGTVVKKARDGAPDALTHVGHTGEPTTHPVCKEVLAAVSAGGTKGSELHKRFDAPAFGWPKDAINGAVLTLLAAGNIRAQQDGKQLNGPKELPPTQIGKVILLKEDDPPTTQQRLAVRSLLTETGLHYEPGQEGPQIPALLQHVKELARQVGGAPPLPEPPDTDHISALQALGGNQLFRAVADDRNQLSDNIKRWSSSADQRAKREKAWDNLLRLRRHAEGLDVAGKVDPAIDAIHVARQLLDEPDPVTPLLDDVTAALRAELQAKLDELSAAQQAAIGELEQWPDWSRLDERERRSILEDSQLAPVDSPATATDGELLDALDAKPLSAWEDRISMVPGRRDQVRGKAAKRLEPESVTVTLPSTTIKSEAELDAFVDDLRAAVLEHVKAGKTVIL